MIIVIGQIILFSVEIKGQAEIVMTVMLFGIFDKIAKFTYVFQEISFHKSRKFLLN